MTVIKSKNVCTIQKSGGQVPPPPPNIQQKLILEQRNIKMIKSDIKYKYQIYISCKCFFFLTFKDSRDKMYQIFHKNIK